LAAAVTLETFAAIVGDTFAVGEGEAVDLELTEARALAADENAPRPSFALTFRGPGEPLLPQATYAFRHSTLELLEIFIVPVARDADGSTYEATFA
jgi:hypothetical protein